MEDLSKIKKKIEHSEFYLGSPNYGRDYDDDDDDNNNNNNNLFTAIGLSPGGSGYFTCMQNIKSVTNIFKSGGLYEKLIVA